MRTHLQETTDKEAKSSSKEVSGQSRSVNKEPEQVESGRQLQNRGQGSAKEVEKTDEVRKDDSHKDGKKEFRDHQRRDNRRKEQRPEERPPAKKMRDDARQQSYYGDGQERSRSGRGRANSREFVRGGRSSRGRSGYSSQRGRGRGARDGHQGYDYEANRGTRQYRDVVQKGAGGQHSDVGHASTDFPDALPVHVEAGNRGQEPTLTVGEEHNNKQVDTKEDEEASGRKEAKEHTHQEGSGRKGKDQMGKGHSDRYVEGGHPGSKSGERRRRNPNHSTREHQSSRAEGGLREHYDDAEGGFRDEDDQGDVPHRGDQARRGGRREGNCCTWH